MLGVIGFTTLYKCKIVIIYIYIYVYIHVYVYIKVNTEKMHLITGARLHLAEPHRARRLCYGLQGQISTMKHEEVMGYSCRYYGNNDYGWLMGYYASVDHQCDTIGDIYIYD